MAQLLQGASTTGALIPLHDALFAAEGGYNAKEPIEFVSDVLCASIFGTHRRDMWYAYAFSDAPISPRQKGMVIEEKGCRAVYTARLRNGTGGRQVLEPLRPASTMSDLQSILSVFERSQDSCVRKSELVSAVNQLKADIASNSVKLDAGSSDVENEEDGRLQDAKAVSNVFREAPLKAWVMKLFVAAPGMKDGT